MKRVIESPEDVSKKQKKKKVNENVNNVGVKKEDFLQKLRNTRAPKLMNNQIQKIVNHEKGFYHTFSTGSMVPYDLSFDMMILACYCGKIFNQSSGEKFRKHLSKIPNECLEPSDNSLIPSMKYDSIECKQLLKKPQFLYNKKSICLKNSQRENCCILHLWNLFKF